MGEWKGPWAERTLTEPKGQCSWENARVNVGGRMERSVRLGESKDQCGWRNIRVIVGGRLLSSRPVYLSATVVV